MGRYLIIDTDKLNLEPKIANQIINAYLWQHDYLKDDREFPVMSEEETEQKFQQIYDQGYNDGVLEEDRQFNELKKTL